MSDPAHFDGPYALIRPLSIAAGSEVHVAQPLGRGDAPAVALKLMPLGGSGSAESQFMRETSALAALRHPAIVRIVDAGVGLWRGRRHGWIATDWIAPGSLAERVLPDRLLPLATALGFGAAIAEGLGHAHRQGVIHRDLKPANVLADVDAHRIAIADFGCARLVQAERSRSGLLVGSPAYMAPEQVLGGDTGPATDWYAYGVLMHELLTGRLPFVETGWPALLRQIVRDTPPPPSTWRPDLPSEVDELLAVAMAKDPTRRCLDATGIAAMFRQMSANYMS